MTRLHLKILVAAALLLAVLAAPASAEIRQFTHRVPVEVKGYEVKTAYDLGIEEPHVNGFITGMSVDVVDADGTPVPINRLMLHHIVFANLARPSPTCDTTLAFDNKTRLPGREIFFGVGEERNVLAFPPGYGIRMGESDQWAMFWMFMNHKAQTDHAFIEYKVTYDTNPNLTAVKPYWMDVRNCRADPVYDVPGGGRRGSTYRQKFTYTMPESGRIVAAGGHVHGGAKNLVLSQPDCGDRKVFTSRPAWGTRSHPFYNVRPILHEPGPISMSGYLSQAGYPVQKGQRMRLTSNYDDERLHTRVMGILTFYLAPGEVADRCGPPPGDAFTVQPAALRGDHFRTSTPKFRVPLTGIDSNGNARTIQRAPGPTQTLASGSTISARDFFFRRPNVVVDQGATLRWAFDPGTLHNVTVANGPRGFSSPNLSDGRSFKRKLKTPGTYQYFCALHPVDMPGTITVRPRRR